jgi:alkylation response protein AidB-like acyl-CoA dehydrogenase
MDLSTSAEEDTFRKEVRSYLDDLLGGDFASIRGRGGPGDEHSCFEERLAWERRLGADGWTCVAWPAEFGGRALPLDQQVIFYEEYARAGGPGRLGHIGEGLIGPTLIHFGTPEQQQRFLPAIRLGHELWCQGSSEPDAGSDLANV